MNCHYCLPGSIFQTFNLHWKQVAFTVSKQHVFLIGRILTGTADWSLAKVNGWICGSNRFVFPLREDVSSNIFPQLLVSKHRNDLQNPVFSFQQNLATLMMPRIWWWSFGRLLRAGVLDKHAKVARQYALLGMEDPRNNQRAKESGAKLGSLWFPKPNISISSKISG